MEISREVTTKWKEFGKTIEEVKNGLNDCNVFINAYGETYTGLEILTIHTDEIDKKTGGQINYVKLTTIFSEEYLNNLRK